MRDIIEIPVTSLLYLSYVAVQGLTPVAHLMLLLDSVAGGQSWQTFLQGPGGDTVSFVGHRDSAPLLSSGHALWQRPEWQVTCGDTRPVRAGAAIHIPPMSLSLREKASQ